MAELNRDLLIGKVPDAVELRLFGPLFDACVAVVTRKIVRYATPASRIELTLAVAPSDKTTISKYTLASLLCPLW